MMDLEEKLTMAEADLEVIANRLGELANLVSTVHLGLAKEKAEQQILDCIMCIWYYVRDLHGQAQQAMSAVRQTQQEDSVKSQENQETPGTRDA